MNTARETNTGTMRQSGRDKLFQVEIPVVVELSSRISRVLESFTMNIVLGITGGIAAYKAPDLVRRLRERDAEVQIVMTASAEEFVTATALQAVSGRPVRSNLWDKEAEAAMSHIELARWADVVLVAPATAEVMARIVSGAAPDLLTTICLATEAPIALAPAMNHVMWNNPATQSNRELLEQRGIHILGPDTGSQACGETGAGRMLDPDVIAATVCGLSVGKGDGVLEGRKVVITAGPTREPIDPVRYITNRSSGKMGYAIARAAAAQGAEVILISGPVSLQPPPGMRVVQVNTAQEMLEATHEDVGEADIFVAAAAVADYRPAEIEVQKIKKHDETTNLRLVRCPDVLSSVSSLEDPPFTVGFAAETENLEAHARAKLENKRLDMIVANRVGDDQGFDRDDNAITVLWPKGRQEFSRAAKTDLARALVDLIAKHFYAASGSNTEPRLTIISNND
jgi:phosphopantothenoylcysteine decarboxylase/phosphopantothenate--cysteine ligase